MIPILFDNNALEHDKLNYSIRNGKQQKMVPQELSFKPIMNNYGVHFPKGLLANYDSASHETIVPTNIHKQHSKLVTVAFDLWL